MPSPSFHRRALGFVAAVAFVGCGSASDPRPASWAYVSAAILAPNCATVSCHGRAAAVSGLDFSDVDRGYTSLTELWIWIVDPTGTAANGCRRVDGTVVCQREHRSLVVPYDPAQSRLVRMLRAEDAPRMPPDRPLAEADIRLVERWILQGARRSDGTPDGATSDAAISDADPSGLDASPTDGSAGDVEGGSAPDSGPSSDGDGGTDTATGADADPAGAPR